MSASLINEPTMWEYANLLAYLHIGEGLNRDRFRDSLYLERISHALGVYNERQGGLPAFPHLAESILATTNQVWPNPDAHKACDTAFRLFGILCRCQTPDAFRLLRQGHSLLRAACRRMVMDRSAGIPV